MRSSGFLVIVYWLLLQGESCLARGDQEIQLPQDVILADQWNGYCFSVLKPLLDHFTQLKVATDANNEMKDKINSLEVTISNLQCQLLNSETKIKNNIEQIKVKEEQIKDKDEQIKDLREHTKLNSEKTDHQREQLEAKINSFEAENMHISGKLNATIEENEVKRSRIMDLEAQIKVYQRQLVELKVAAEANYKMNDKINSLEVTINNLQCQLLNSETKIKNNIEQNKVKEEQITDKDEQIKDKDELIKDLREQMKLVSGVLAEKNDQLSKINQTAENIPETCGSGTPNSIFQIKVRGIKPFQAPCVSASSGWTVIQRRVNDNENFNRNWADYKLGFGNIRENFFLGLEKIHLMTLLQPHELYIQLRDVNGSTSYARYDDFRIGSEEEGYKLKSLGEYSGTAGDSLTKYQLNMKFSTLDRDNDTSEKSNCARYFGGGWWFFNCGQSNLNGNYYHDGTSGTKKDGIYWGSWKNYDYTISLTFSQMMIRPKTL